MSEKKNIWLVEDDDIFVFGIQRIIKKLNTNINIKSFSNGKFAIDALTDCINHMQEIPDIILLDIYMPVMDGWEFLDEYRMLSFDKSSIRIYMLTSSDNDNDLIESKNYAEISDYFIKPLEEDILERIIM